MATALPNLLDTPTYLLVIRIGDDQYFQETKVGTKLFNVVGELDRNDDIEAVLMIEDFKVIDVTSEVAWTWYNANQGRPDFESEDLPGIVQDHCGNAYHDWCRDTGYETACTRSHEAGRTM